MEAQPRRNCNCREQAFTNNPETECSIPTQSRQGGFTICPPPFYFGYEGMAPGPEQLCALDELYQKASDEANRSYNAACLDSTATWEANMKKLIQISLLTLCALVLMASEPGSPAWRMKADYMEACSAHLFCPCYFNKHAEHPHCEFNMAVKVRDGHSGKTNLTGAKYWLTGDLGDEWGTNKKGSWVVVSFDPSTTKEQRDALAPMIPRPMVSNGAN